ncbi:MAG: cytochrome c [Spongiibacteraceae bacterium]|jgi:mono/diheme cytochrome c family protein|nr:cytochrome c [Spongiibacteraceae bacterium]
MAEPRYALVFSVALALSGLAAAADPAASGGNGEALFAARCGACHFEEGMGSNVLAKRLGPERALLAQRDDLNAEYVRLVVRRGMGMMPFLTRVDVPDAELEAITGWLTRQR